MSKSFFTVIQNAEKNIIIHMQGESPVSKSTFDNLTTDIHTAKLQLRQTQPYLTITHFLKMPRS